MTTHFAPLKIRQRLGQAWGPPSEFGTDGWQYRHTFERGAVIITCSDHDGFEGEIVHASMAFVDRDPTYLEMAHLQRSVWPGGYAYMVFAPEEFHVNIHEHALHLWGRLDGKPLLPELSADIGFGMRSI